MPVVWRQKYPCPGTGTRDRSRIISRLPGQTVGHHVAPAVGAEERTMRQYVYDGLDHGIGHLALMRPQNNERLNPTQG
jgi:hypothetical protein